MFDVPNTKGSTMMITNSKNSSEAINIAKMVKTKGKKSSLKMINSITIIREQVI